MRLIDKSEDARKYEWGAEVAAHVVTWVILTERKQIYKFLHEENEWLSR